MSVHPKWLQDADDEDLRDLPPEVLARINEYALKNITLNDINACLQEQDTMNGV